VVFELRFTTQNYCSADGDYTDEPFILLHTDNFKYTSLDNLFTQAGKSFAKPNQ
jgi:hypothetical protein